MLTAWDGYFRVDYLGGRLQVTVQTVEPTITGTLRPGLSASFVATDPGGPPVFVALDLGDGLTADASVLLGPRLAEAATEVLAGPSRVRSGRLDLAEVADLADTWAPYRMRVLAPAAPTAAGSWAAGLWTSLGGGALRELLRAPAPATPAFRDSAAAEAEWHRFDLPPELAESAGIRPWLDWRVFDDDLGRELVVRAESVAGSAGLLVGLDDGRGTWVPLEPDPGEAGVLAAALPLESAEPSGLTLRTVGDDD